jgi:D-alanyl-D-alanine carboxypeptidase/D-alanyl-D-alanine-endopeptidase (penicillin-binding protein 4)
MRSTRPTPATRAAVGAVLAGSLLLWSGPAASAGETPSRTGTSPTSSTVTRTYNPAAYATTTGDARMASALTSRATTSRFGTSFSGAVVDAASNTTVWSRSGSTGRMPASTNKLVTASNALTVFGPDKRFTTQVRTGSTATRVVLVGSGDPSLRSSALDAMAKTTAAALLAKGITAGRVYVDDDVFPTPSLAYGWKESYVPDSIAPVRAVVRDQRNNSDTSAEAARYFRDRLKAYGVTEAGYYGRADAASTSTVIASSRGSTVASMVSTMLLNSDNEIAEALHKLVGIALGYGATWSGARTAQAVQLSAQKLSSGTLYDGSGLSRADRLSALQLARIVDRGIDPATQTTLWPLKSGLPTAGKTGTLASRFTTTASKCAVGKVFAKTGTLGDVVAMAGWTTGADGRVKTFAFLVNYKDSTTTLKQNVDMLAATVNGCY